MPQEQTINNAVAQKDREALRALLKEATPGPWYARKENGPEIRGPGAVTIARLFHPPLRSGHDHAALIVAAINALPGLLDELDDLRDRLEHKGPTLEELVLQSYRPDPVEPKPLEGVSAISSADAVEALADAKTLLNQIALERRKLGPLATQAQQMAHRLAALSTHPEATPSERGDRDRPNQAWITRAAQIESAARGLLEAVDDALKLRKRTLLACSRQVLEERCDSLAEAVNTPEPRLSANPSPVSEGLEPGDLGDSTAKGEVR